MTKELKHEEVVQNLEQAISYILLLSDFYGETLGDHKKASKLYSIGLDVEGALEEL